VAAILNREIFLNVDSCLNSKDGLEKIMHPQNNRSQINSIKMGHHYNIWMPITANPYKYDCCTRKVFRNLQGRTITIIFLGIMFNLGKTVQKKEHQDNSPI